MSELAAEAGPEAAPWRVECAVTLTPEEIRQSVAASWKRAGVRNGATGDWRVFAMAVAVGAVCGMVAVVAHVVPPNRAGGIAAGGFLACWAGAWLFAGATRRAQVRSTAQAWDEVDRSYTMRASDRELEFCVPGRLTRIAWSGVDSAECVAGTVRIWMTRGSVVVVPERALPPGWPPARLAAAANVAIGRDRKGARAQAG